MNAHGEPQLVVPDSTEKAFEGVPALSDGLPLPGLIIFDLDYTLWPFWVDTHVDPPLKSKTPTQAVDRNGQALSFYRDVPAILHALSLRPIPIGIASRTSAPDLAQKLLKLLYVPLPPDANEDEKQAWTYFKHREIYPGDKRQHMRALHKASRVAFEDMLFFDDEHRNRNVTSLGVCFHLVPRGVDKAEVQSGIEQWRKELGKK